MIEIWGFFQVYFSTKSIENMIEETESTSRKIQYKFSNSNIDYQMVYSKILVEIYADCCAIACYYLL